MSLDQRPPSRLPAFLLHLFVLSHAAACGTAMRPTRLSPPLSAWRPGLHIDVQEVHLSQELRRLELGEDSRVLVVLDLRAEAPMQLDLRAARLALVDFAGRETWRPALASGIGEPPRWLDDGDQVPPLQLQPDELLRVWVAFGHFPARVHGDLQERVLFELPGGPRIALAEPGALPVWEGEGATYTSGMGAWLQASADEGAFNLLINDQHVAWDPVVFSLSYGFGVRVPQWPSQGGQEIVCCNIALATAVAWPLFRSEELILSPFVGGEAAFLASDDDVERRSWFGPELGLELSGPPLSPRHGPFPVVYPRPLLGSYNVRAALVHWFGPDRSAPSFGATLILSSSYGN
jgi:hypothetical protein